MTFKTTKLRDAISFALVAGATTLAGTGIAFAQETPAAEGEQAEATTLDRIEVTGSRIRRVDAETASPVFTMDRADIEATGAVTVGDFLQETPAISGGATNPQVNNGGGAGAATVSLRGLGSERTLILVNGRRMQTNNVNAIPINMVERVEVLKDGASAIYGSDAIGGVVNFILRKNFDGAIATATHGFSSRSDGATTSADLTIGTTTDKGSLVIGMNYNKQERVNASDRPHSRAQFYYYYGEVFENGSSRVPNGRYVVPESVSGLDCNNDGDLLDNQPLIRIDGAAGTSISDFRCFIGVGENNDNYNFQVANVNVTPQERFGMFVNGSYMLTDNVEAYVEGFYNKTRSSFEIASEPFDGRPSQANVPISADNLYNPFGVDITDARLRLVNVGPRSGSFETNDFRSVIGLKGAFGDSSWVWDVGWIHGELEQNAENHGELFRSKLVAALGPSMIDPVSGDPICVTTPGDASTVINGCTPVNFFGPAPAPGTPEYDALQAIAPYFHSRISSSMRSYYANVTGDLFELPGGFVQLAVGVESSKETFESRPDALIALNPITGECDTSGNCSSPVSGSLGRNELYGELYIPVLSDAPFAERLAFTLGSRYSDYDLFGDTTNSKIGLEWKPFADLLVRGTFAEVFRAPTIGDLFSPTSESADSYDDPCNGTTTNPNNACQNVPLDGSFNQSDTQLNATLGGNPNLTPEEGWVRTIGAVYSPSWAEGLSLTADLWHVKIENNIGALGSSNILNACYRDGNFCDRFTRNSAGEVDFIDDRLTNPGRFDTKGVDFSIKYVMRDTPWGSFRASLDTTYTIQFDRQVLDDEGNLLDYDDFAGEFADDSNGGSGHFARWRALGNLAWNMGDWSANYSVRYIHHVDEQAKYSGGLLVGVPELRVPSVTTHDIAASYTFAPNYKVTLGVDNFTDRLAPLIYGGFNGSTDVRTYDTMGRFYFGRIEFKF